MIETYFHSGEGYNPFLIREGWQVAQLNYLPGCGLDDIDKVEVHKNTDEVFILVRGHAVLIEAEPDKTPVSFHCINMDCGVTYNVQAGTWHNIAMEKDVEIIIVEKSNTHLHDCTYNPLDQESRTRLYAMIKSELSSKSLTEPVKMDRKRIWSQSFIESFSSFAKAEEVACSVNDLQIDDAELYRSLEFGSEKPDAYMVEFIQKLKSEALSLCIPRFGYRFLSGERKDKQSLTVGGLAFRPDSIIVKCLQNSEFYAEVVASVGKELDDWIEKKRSGNDVMEAFVADALGSVIVEAIVSWGTSFLTQKMAPWNLKVSNSYSPGYCGWDVSEQKLFFSLLPHQFCGISLLDSCLMLPIKSVSALVGIGENIEKKPYGCAICRKKDCFKRRLS
jgi:hypothetical protein